MDAKYERNKLILITAFITMVVTSAIWIGIGAAGYWAIYNETPPFGVAVDHPDEVALGDVFKVRVTVTNDGEKDLKLDTLDVYKGFLDGFEIIGTYPKPRTTERIIDYISYGFSQSLKPGESFDFDLHLRAKELGLWGGDIDAVTPSLSLITNYTEIEVVDVAAAQE